MKAYNIKNQKGFTLVEILASITVLVAVLAIMAGVISSSLRGASKTNTIETVRKNGNYAISQITKNIEYAETFEGFSNDGTTYTTSCPFSPSPTPTTQETNYKYIKIKPFNSNTSIEYFCDGSNSEFKANGVSVVDDNSVHIQNCSISCTKTKATDVPIIGISLSLESKNSTGLVENTVPPIKFETSVTIRNYRK